MGEENSTTGAVVTSSKNPSKQFYDLSLRYPSKQTTEYKGVRLNLPADDKFSFKGKNIWLPVIVERNKPVNIGYILYITGIEYTRTMNVMLMIMRLFDIL